MASFSVDFRILAGERGWDDRALRGVFVKSLCEDLKDKLATQDEPDSLEGLIALVIWIDNRLRKRNRERSSSRRKTVSPPSLVDPPQW